MGPLRGREIDVALRQVADRSSSGAAVICSICLAQGQEQELDQLPLVFAGRATDRARVLAGARHWNEAAVS